MHLLCGGFAAQHTSEDAEAKTADICREAENAENPTKSRPNEKHINYGNKIRFAQRKAGVCVQNNAFKVFLKYTDETNIVFTACQQMGRPL